MNLRISIHHGEHGGHGEKLDVLVRTRNHRKGSRKRLHKFSFFAVFAVPAVVDCFS